MAPPGSWSVKNDAWLNSRKYWRTSWPRARSRTPRSRTSASIRASSSRSRAANVGALACQLRYSRPTISSTRLRREVSLRPTQALKRAPSAITNAPCVRAFAAITGSTTRAQARPTTAARAAPLRTPASRRSGTSRSGRERPDDALQEQARAERDAGERQEGDAVAAAHQDPDDGREQREVERLGPEELREARDLRIEQQQGRGSRRRSRRIR
jgi:hypothetical protein